MESPYKTKNAVTLCNVQAIVCEYRNLSEWKLTAFDPSPLDVRPFTTRESVFLPREVSIDKRKPDSLPSPPGIKVCQLDIWCSLFWPQWLWGSPTVKLTVPILTGQQTHQREKNCAIPSFLAQPLYSPTKQHNAYSQELWAAHTLHDVVFLS